MKVVLIDDDFDDYIFLKDAIEEYDQNFECIHFGDSDCAMESLLEIEDQRPDYVFIDINMPRTTGDECLRALKKSGLFDEVKIVMLSTFMSDEFAESLMNDGAAFAVAKPNSMNDYRNLLISIFESAKA